MTTNSGDKDSGSRSKENRMGTRLWKRLKDVAKSAPVQRTWRFAGNYCALFIGIGGMLATKDRITQYWTGEPPLEEKVKEIGADVRKIGDAVQKQDSKLGHIIDSLDKLTEKQASSSVAAAPAVASAPADST